MVEEIKGEKLKERLISFRKDLIALNDENKKLEESFKTSKLDPNIVEEWIKGSYEHIEKNNQLIEIVESQLEREFNISRNNLG